MNTEQKAKKHLRVFQIRSYFWSVFSDIQTKYRKIQTRNNSVFGQLLRSATYSH